MTLSELVAYVGDDHIQLQNLLESAGSVDMLKNGETKITFYTKAITAHEVATHSAKKLGLVIWLPVERLPPKSAGSPSPPVEE